MNSKAKVERPDEGAVAVIVAVCAVVFFLIAALVVDLGIAMDQRRDAQKAVDLAALAGGQELPDTDAAADAADAHQADVRVVVEARHLQL